MPPPPPQLQQQQLKHHQQQQQQPGPGPCSCAAAVGDSSSHASTSGSTQRRPPQLQPGDELDEDFSGLDAGSGWMTVCGFGSLLSERSARSTFPDLKGFRVGRLHGWRRVFAHAADIFFERGIANLATGEFGSLSCEPIIVPDAAPTSAGSSSSSGSLSLSEDSDGRRPGSGSSSGPSLVVTLFEVPFSPASVAALIEREHEFRFVAVQAHDLSGSTLEPRLAVLCGSNTDEHYRQTRCRSDAEWQQRWGRHGVTRVWNVPGVLPCRVYLRHCVLAAKGCGPEAYQSFLDDTFLADRATTVRAYLQQHPGILEEQPPPELVGRYSG